MDIREAARVQAPSLTLQRALVDLVAALDAQLARQAAELRGLQAELALRRDTSARVGYRLATYIQHLEGEVRAHRGELTARMHEMHRAIEAEWAREDRAALLFAPTQPQAAHDRPAQRAALAGLLRELRADADRQAENAWRRRKGPMAAYWRAVATYARHTAHALRDGPRRPVAARARARSDS